jgi:hypothetical protein
LWGLLTINSIFVFLVSDLGLLLFILFHCFICFAPCLNTCL